MSEKEKFTQVIKNRIVKTVLWSAIVFLLAFVLIISALQIPYIQTKVVNELTQVVSEKIKFPVTIGYVNLSWFDQLILEDVNIKDPTGVDMIYVEEMLVDFQLSSLLDKKNINIDEVILKKSNVKLIKNSAVSGLNINEFIQNLRAWLASDKPAENPPVFTIDEIELQNSSFSLNDPARDSITTGFDYYHFNLEDIDLSAENFLVVADTLEFNLLSLVTREPVTDLAIKEMSTFFRLSKNEMQFLGLDLKANESVIKDTVILKYDNTGALSYFTDSVSFEANLSSTVIYSKDLGLFAPYMKTLDEYYEISGDINGKVKNLTIKDMTLSFGESSKLVGNISFDGLPDFQETFIEGDLENSFVLASDIEKYVSSEIYSQAKKLGKIDLDARFVGFPNDFVANGSFKTSIGNIISDINLKIDESTKKSFYSGSLSTINFNMGALTGRPDLVQLINMKGHISGSGFKIENAAFDLKATISKIGFKNYTYRNIVTDATMAAEFFEGKMSIDDPNLKFNAVGSIDLRENINSINIQANLDTALLKPLKLSKKDIVINTSLDLNIRGLDIDSIVGEANFIDSYFRYEERELNIDTLKIISLKNSEGRDFGLDSDFVNLSVVGDFEFSQFYEDIIRLVKEYKLNFLNNQQNINNYYANKRKTEYDKYDLDFDIELVNLNPISNLFLPGLSISDSTAFQGSFSGGYTSILSLNGSIDTLSYSGIEFFDSEVDLNTSKIADSTNVLAMAYFFSESQKLKNLTNTKDFLFEGVWFNDHIDFRSNIVAQEEENFINLNGDLLFLKNKTEISFEKSDIFAIGKQWDLSPENKIIISNKEISFDNIKFFHGEQNITVNGAISDSVDKKLTVEINNFDVSNLDPVLAYDFDGEINGYLEIQNLYNEMLMESEMAINDFTIETFLVGDLSGSSKWNNLEKQLDINYQINRLSRKIMDLAGYIKPQEEKEQLNILATFDQANINIAEPFIKEVFSEIKGVASGEFQISGMINYPILTGEGEIKDGGFKLNYLNTTYTFGGKLHFDANEIGVRELNLYDEKSNKAILNGGIFHDGFKNFVIDLRANMNNFQVMNTSRNDNDLYYGTAYVTGRLDILGGINNLHFDARAITNKGTELFIPIESTSGVQQESFINFVAFRDSLALARIDTLINQIDLKGINLDFDIEITPDAYTEIIFDLQAGDIIRGRGNGKIKLLIDTNGDFNMFGNYEFVSGGYNFTLYNIINKEFEIRSGSTINWHGDPYEGILDIKASYEQMASLAPLLNVSEEVELTAELKRRYPSEVILELDGPLLSPEIGFDINITNYPENATTPGGGPSLGNAVDLFLSRINLDRQERERQVFSLIILRQFSPENSFNTSGSFGSSVSELFSNQLSYWITQVDENLEIDVDLSGLDAEALNTFQLRLSYSFFDGRLRVTRDGSFTDVENEANPLSVLGEWTVEYFLTADGRFRAKVYNRNNYNSWVSQADQDNRQTSFSGGVSLLHITSFDAFSEIFGDKKKERQQPENKKEPIPEKKESQEIPPLNVVNPRENDTEPSVEK